ncbi:28S ribosomal protein S33 [Tropilaelaps mercedesae]|uniref:Small ribosomal subunit protein mS33 n=1 Tax=Tropilaelaps mercedesae TaxID=418985 RepID=A0A1V9XUU4_9ACAR|nr:28S ribosomal protein S33 [Tropilaelaps mercedesae]
MSSSSYAIRMAKLSARVFVEHPPGKKTRRIHRLLSAKPNDLEKEVVNYYPPHHDWTRLMYHVRAHGLFRDEHQDFRDEIRRLRILRGKMPVIKGEGKRAILANK